MTTFEPDYRVDPCFMWVACRPCSFSYTHHFTITLQYWCRPSHQGANSTRGNASVCAPVVRIGIHGKLLSFISCWHVIYLTPLSHTWLLLFCFFKYTHCCICRNVLGVFVSVSRTPITFPPIVCPVLLVCSCQCSSEVCRAFWPQLQHRCESSLLLLLRPPLKSHIPLRWPVDVRNTLWPDAQMATLCPPRRLLASSLARGDVTGELLGPARGPRPAKRPALLRVCPSSRSGTETRAERA